MPDRAFAGKRILLVEDEPNIAASLQQWLTEAGYVVSVAPDGNIGYVMAERNEYDLYMLDVMLPGINGLELCKMIRKLQPVTPVLLLTALGTTDNVVAGLDSGADDYVVKPFRFPELMARVRALLRRAGGERTRENLLSVAGLEMDLDARLVSRYGTPISLTATEYRMLEFFMKNQRRVISRMDLLEHVWGVDFNMATNVVDVYINYLRKKIDRDFEPKLLHTVIGMGYQLKDA